MDESPYEALAMLGATTAADDAIVMDWMKSRLLLASIEKDAVPERKDKAKMACLVEISMLGTVSC